MSEPSHPRPSGSAPGRRRLLQGAPLQRPRARFAFAAAQDAARAARRPVPRRRREHDEGVRDGDPAHTVHRTLAARPRRSSPAPHCSRASWCSASTPSWSATARSSQGAGRRRGHALRAPARRPPARGVQRSVPHLAQARADDARGHGCDLPQPHRRRARRVHQFGEWRDRAGAYAIQGIGSGLVSASTVTTSTSSGCPWPSWCDCSLRSGARPFSWLASQT